VCVQLRPRTIVGEVVCHVSVVEFNLCMLEKKIHF
jgi:hypothetical protein